MKTKYFPKFPLNLLLIGLIAPNAWAVEESQSEPNEDVMTVTAKAAEEALKQQLGVSIITSQDIEKTPPTNDLSDIIRKMPGVNLTGNSSSGSRGNNRQIDIRGMGPENTLILVDGTPVTSRNSVRYSWRGERDTRGDSNWVPAEMVDRIEVIRGPAAARYGSGSAGGVVNIITKKPTNEWQGMLSLYTNQPENDKEGATKRANFSLSGPLIDDVLTMRLYGNINKTDADDADINTSENGSYAAGHEGVRNKDINAEFQWKINEQQILQFDYGYSRQGNIYAGDTQYSNGNISTTVQDLAKSGAETNKMYRQNYGLTHNGFWDWGESKLGFSYEKTNNTRLPEGSTGRVEGMINDPSKFETSRLDSYRVNGEVIIPFDTAINHTLTLGTEYTRDTLDDPASMRATNSSGVVVGDISGDPDSRSSKNSANNFALFIEDNLMLTESTDVIVGLRYDHHSKFGNNFTPSLNLSQGLGEYFKLKAGIARVFKAPNLYQSSEDYLLKTRGNGCPPDITSGGCYLLGNNDLDAEISINKEIGLEFSHEGYKAGVTYFRNDYKNKIVAGTEIIGTASDGYHILRWENGGKAIVEGIEASLIIPVTENTLNWRSNFTYMINSKNKSTGNPLSIIPKYTINTALDWQITDKLSSDISLTFYGRQKPREYVETRNETNNGLVSTPLGAYAITAIGLRYEVNKNLRLSAGVNNLFDKQLYRDNEGASTYNEPGRSYYLGVTTSF